MVLISPEGTRIIGTLEKLTGRAEIDLGSVRAAPHGGFTFEFEGTTEVFWDGQETEVWDGERVFLDADGNEFTENVLRLVPEDSIPETAESLPAQMPTEPRTIVIMKDGGLIESVVGVPPGVYAQVIDLDGKGAARLVITVTMEGGVIHSVEGIPAGVMIRTIDLDVEGVEPERVTALPDGQAALITEYEAEAPAKP